MEITSTKTYAFFHLQKEILSCLERGMSNVIKTFDLQTGRFLAPDGEWIVANQHIVYPVALPGLASLFLTFCK